MPPPKRDRWRETVDRDRRASSTLLRVTQGNSTDDRPTTRAERYEHGRAVFGAVNEAAPGAIAEALADVSPELEHQISAWAYGEMYARPHLEPRDRQLVTLGMLAALGGCEAQLDIHVGTALDVGLTPREIVEALLQSAVYCGFPRALNATAVAKDVFARRGLLPVE